MVDRVAVLEWLSSPENPSVRYLTARELIKPRPSETELARMREDVMQWEPLRAVLDRQLEGGNFPSGQKTPTAQPTFTALCLMQRCGLAATDEPVRHAIEFLEEQHLSAGALSYTSGGSGVLPCYLGVVSTALVKMGATDSRLVQSALSWLVDHQRFDHKKTKGGGSQQWHYKAPQNFGCWESVSCYHGVVGAFRALAAVPPTDRSDLMQQRIDEAINYLRVHRIYRKTSNNQPLFRHMTQFFLVGDYRSHLLDVLEGLADADASLVEQDWVRSALADVEALLEDDCIPLIKNYGRKLMYPIPVEKVGEPSRFLTLQWLRILKGFDYQLAT